MIRPSLTMIAPTGTSPRACAVRASDSASAIQRSSSAGDVATDAAAGSEFGRLTLALSADNRVGFDLHQHIGIDQRAHLNHRGGWADIAEGFAVRTADLFPARNIGYVDARTHDVGELCTGLRQRTLDVGDGLLGLRICVALADELAARIGRGRAGDPDLVAH